VAESQTSIPLVVDLDGTLCKSDVCVEGILLLIKQQPLAVLRLPFWLLSGRAAFKRRIAERIATRADELPYNTQLIEQLNAHRTGGGHLALATAADEIAARPVFEHLGIFDRLFASDGTHNLAGSAKRDAVVDAYDEGGFDYAGNGHDDIAVWQSARTAIVVNADRGVLERARLLGRPTTVIDDRPNSLRAFRVLLRPHQWAKNLLLFVPLLTAHKLHDMHLIALASLAFVAFCLCASSVYVLNDLLDLSDDRRHPRKRLRPFAAGDLKLTTGLWLAPLLLAAGLTLAGFVSLMFLATLVLYYAVTLTYSLTLKRRPMIDVLLLASLYTLRMVAGAVAIAVPASFWLLAFSLFIFSSLALLKRYTELVAFAQRPNANADTQVRGYRLGDTPLLATLGGAAGYLAVLVLALYIDSPAVRDNYRHGEALWLLCPLLLYWISRAWLIAHRGLMDDDPVLFALKDRTSILAGLLTVVIGVAAL
jgi:4-hydroxybenzoate polyprenyltransferase/phosphoserine phosphatase